MSLLNEFKTWKRSVLSIPATENMANFSTISSSAIQEAYSSFLVLTSLIVIRIFSRVVPYLSSCFLISTKTSFLVLRVSLTLSKSRINWSISSSRNLPYPVDSLYIEPILFQSKLSNLIGSFDKTVSSNYSALFPLCLRKNASGVISIFYSLSTIWLRSCSLKVWLVWRWRMSFLCSRRLISQRLPCFYACSSSGVIISLL